MQIGIVVRDIEKTAKAWASLFGFPVPSIRNAYPHINYKGKPVETKARLCAFSMGAVTLELIQPDETETSWKQFLDEKGEGVHFLGLMVPDLPEALKTLEENGITRRHFGGAQWGSYSLMESEAALGATLSVKCNTPME